MSKHKTRAEKKQSSKRSEVNKHNTAFTYSTTGAIPKTRIQVNENELLVTDPKYIYKDLLRTLVLAIIFFAVLIWLYTAMESGKLQLTLPL